MSCVRHPWSSWGSSEEIISDNGDTGTPRSWMSDISPRPVAGKHDGDCIIRQFVSLPSGCSVDDDPMGKDCVSRAHCPSHVSRRTGGAKVKETEPVEGYLKVAEKRKEVLQGQ